MEYKPDISWNWRGMTQMYHVTLDCEEVHSCKTPYERDMFIAELKARLKFLEHQRRVSDDEI